MSSTITNRRSLIPAEVIQKVKEVEIDDILEYNEVPSFPERGNLHNFWYRENDGLLEATVSGISLSGGYKKIEFYKGKYTLAEIAVKGIKEDGKCDFTTESMYGIVEDVDDVEFLEGINGEIISIAKKGNITMGFENSTEPIYIVGEKGKIRVFKCEQVKRGKIHNSLLVAIKEENEEVEFFVDGKEIEQEYDIIR